jgi:formate hydrogenlyase subunit 3/multisubunit Na+/H+ antiporter MnhD subunit
MYTIRAFQRIWWLEPAEGIYTKPAGDQLVAPVLLLIMIVALGIWASPLVMAAQEASAWLSDPSVYIQAVLGG